MAVPVLSRKERLARLALMRSRGIGPRLHGRLLARYGSGVAAWEALPQLCARGELGRRVSPVPFARVVRELERAEALGIRLVCPEEAAYPARLRHLPDPPPVVALAGDGAALAGPVVAVVGARHASAAGCRLARRLAAGLAEAGVTVVSGLARGIDGAAHEGSLVRPGRAVAVLACGLDRCYPPEHARLQARIREQGLLLSERPLGAAPEARHFPRRNRLIAALAHVVVVVEAAQRSGSLMTARIAGELGREVAAVPGTAGDPRHGGTHRLLREGAQLVERVEDVLALLPTAAPGRSGKEPTPTEPEPPARTTPTETPAPPAEPSFPETTSLRDRLRGLLGPEPQPLDALARTLGHPADRLREALLALELELPLRWYPGDLVARVEE